MIRPASFPALRPPAGPPRRCGLGPGLALALLSLAPVLVGGTRAADDTCRVPDAPRVVAVGERRWLVDGAFVGGVDIEGRPTVPSANAGHDTEGDQ